MQEKVLPMALENKLPRLQAMVTRFRRLVAVCSVRGREMANASGRFALSCASVAVSCSLVLASAPSACQTVSSASMMVCMNILFKIIV